ncbi:MAG: amino acid permease [Actinomycetes bacterium]
MESTQSQQRVLSTGRVVFIVIAAAAPMAAMVGNVPIALSQGNGAGLPAAFVVAALVLLCFSVGYAEMSRRVVNTGAFYTYVSRALGKPPGVGAAYVALASYASMAIGLLGGFSYFMQQVLDGLGIHVPWFVFAVIGLVIVGTLGYRSVDLSSKVLGVLMSLEFIVLLVFAFIVIGKQGVHAFPVASFSSTQVFSGPIGIALIIAFTSFVGFESAALYGEETRDPERSIPRATYIAVSTVGAFYIFITWVIVGAVGVDSVRQQAHSDGGVFVLNLINSYGGEIVYDIAAVLLCTSVLASYSALHNAASRYLFALGREAIMPRVFANYHKEFFSPHIASMAISAISAVVATIFAVLNADPYRSFAAALIGMGTLGIVALQALASLSVVVFFWGRKDRKLWNCIVAPIIGFVGLTSAFVLAATNYNTLTGSNSQIINLVPLVLVVLAVVGVVKGLNLRKNKPAIYARLASSQLRVRRTSLLSAAQYSTKYCIIGAGPSGLVTARAFLKEGVPFDWFERHSDVGGIWDMNNPGSPMYESAHFISSKYTSGFIGYPMPADYPDYPTWEQIRDYIRSFARAFGLYDRVTLNTGVQSATPNSDGTWSVVLETGATHTYAGVVIATGTNWHPNQAELPGSENFAGRISHSVNFRSGDEFIGKKVLIVGAGNSGVDIACDAARFADAAYLSVRRGYRFVPKHIFGLPTDALLAGVIDPPRGVSLAGDANKLIDTLVGDLTRLGLPKPDHDVLSSHPIMNTQVLYHMAHGDLVAKSDVARIHQNSVEFVDGTSEVIDHIVLATGYEYSVPFLQAPALTWKHGRPQLYLRLFAREYDNLYFIGFAEFADAAYKRFEDMAHMIVMDIRLHGTGELLDQWSQQRRTDDPDLSGGHDYIDSPRHTGYIDVETYREYLATLRDEYHWYDFDESSFENLKVLQER